MEKYSIQWLLSRDDSFRYQMLDRMRSDCEYFLGNGQLYGPRLWAGTVDEQIKAMKALWESFASDAKPEWLTWEQIEKYEKDMNNPDWVLTQDYHFRYEMLGKLCSQCSLFHNTYEGDPSKLWGKSTRRQIEVMKALMASIEKEPDPPYIAPGVFSPDKPSWAKIEEYERILKKEHEINDKNNIKTETHYN